MQKEVQKIKAVFKKELAPEPEQGVKLKFKLKPKPAVPVPVPVPPSPFNQSLKSNKTITITYGECAENHVGMQKLGHKAERGLTVRQLSTLEAFFKNKGCVTELTMLTPSHLKEDGAEDAAILIVRGGVHALDVNPDNMYLEQANLPQDTKAKMKGRVVNKHARYNLCFGNNNQEPDYENGKGRIISFAEVPLTGTLKDRLTAIVGTIPDLKAEGNYYYDGNQCGIGYHGDAERKIVIAVRLGSDMPLHYWWYRNSQRIGDRINLMVRHGDIYFMSEKATGHDWLKRSIYTLRHAAGCSKYTN